MANNSNNESVAIRSVQMPVFDGTHATFQVWWMRFTAFAIVHRFKAAISPEGAEEDLTSDGSNSNPCWNRQSSRQSGSEKKQCGLCQPLPSPEL